MNYIFFLLPILMIGFPLVYAQTVDEGIDYTIEKIEKDTYRHTIYSYDRINDNGIWRDYIFTDLGTSLEIKTPHNKIQLDKSSCAFNFFNGNGQLLFTDSIMAYQSVVDQYSWNAVTQVNNAVCEAYYDENEQSLVAKRHAAGVGTMEYKYIFGYDKWKTQLEATNLSSLTNRVFAFDQTVDLNLDVIKWGGNTKNLDDFSGQTFNRTFLENNQAKMIDFMNGKFFDFDVGFDYLDSVYVLDTGNNKSKLVFHYMRNNEILLPGETLVIDPTYAQNAARGSYILDTNNNNVCNDTGGTYTNSTNTALYALVYATTEANDCIRNWAKFNTSTIPINSTFSSGDIEYITNTAFNTGDLINTYLMDVDPITRTAAQQFDDIDDGTLLGSAVNVAAPNPYTITFDAGDLTALEAKIPGGYMSFGMRMNNEVQGGATRGSVFDSPTGSTPPVLTIVYTVPPPPDSITDLAAASVGFTTASLSFTPPNLHGSSLINYMLNVTTPQQDAPITTFWMNGSSSPFSVTGLTVGTDYSAQASAYTNKGGNWTFANVLNFTTDITTYNTPPTNLVARSLSASQIDLQWVAPVGMDNINGYKIQRETPIGTGWSTIVTNTTNTNIYYNNTGLTTNIIYNYRVYALNGTGASTASNTYSMTAYHIPDPVTDLSGTPTDLSTIDLSWSAPTSYAPAILGYIINGTTPTGEPVDVLNANTGTTATSATALNLLIGQEYSFRVSAITVHGKNAGGNIWNGSTIQTFVIGNLSNPDITNDNDFSIFFDRTDLNASAIQLDVTYPNSYNLSCDFSYKYARTNQTYSGLTTVPDGTDDQTATFTLINATGDLVQVRCWDPATGDESTYVITITDFPFLQQIQSLRNGDYGTFFQIGAFDGVMLIIIFLGMIGLNRTTPIVGIIFVVITTLTMSYFELITYPVIMYPALIMMIVWAFITTRKDD